MNFLITILLPFLLMGISSGEWNTEDNVWLNCRNGEGITVVAESEFAPNELNITVTAANESIVIMVPMPPIQFDNPGTMRRTLSVSDDAHVNSAYWQSDITMEYVDIRCGE